MSFFERFNRQPPIRTTVGSSLCPCHGGVHYYKPGDNARQATGVRYPEGK